MTEAASQPHSRPPDFLGRERCQVTVLCAQCENQEFVSIQVEGDLSAIREE